MTEGWKWACMTGIWRKHGRPKGERPGDYLRRARSKRLIAELAEGLELDDWQLIWADGGLGTAAHPAVAKDYEDHIREVTTGLNRDRTGQGARLDSPQPADPREQNNDCDLPKALRATGRDSGTEAQGAGKARAGCIRTDRRGAEKHPWIDYRCLQILVKPDHSDGLTLVAG